MGKKTIEGFQRLFRHVLLTLAEFGKAASYAINSMFEIILKKPPVLK